MMTGQEIVIQEKAELFKAIELLELQKKEIEKQESAMRSELMKAMEDHGVLGIDIGNLSVTYVPKTTRTSIDSKRLKAELPDVATFYSKESPVSASLRIKVVESGSKG